MFQFTNEEKAAMLTTSALAAGDVVRADPALQDHDATVQIPMLGLCVLVAQAANDMEGYLRRQEKEPGSVPEPVLRSQAELGRTLLGALLTALEGHLGKDEVHRRMNQHLSRLAAASPEVERRVALINERKEEVLAERARRGLADPPASAEKAEEAARLRAQEILGGDAA